MLRLFMDGTLFWSANPEELPGEYMIQDLKKEEAINEAGKLTFSILSLHPRYSEMRIRYNGFLLANDNDCLFVGRLKTFSEDMNGLVSVEVCDCFGILDDHVYVSNQQIEIEDELCYVVYYYELFNGISTILTGVHGPRVYIDSIEKHYGSISSSAWINLESTNAKSYSSIILDNVIKGVKGFRITHEGGTYNGNNKTYGGLTLHLRLDDNVNMIDDDENSLSNDFGPKMIFEFGENILNYSIEQSLEDIVTGFYPMATDSKGAHYTGDYRFNDDLYSKYGERDTVVDFGTYDAYDCTKSSDRTEFFNRLNAEADEWETNHLKDYDQKVTITGIDNYYLGISTIGRPIRIGDSIQIIISGRSFEAINPCLSMSIDYFDHQNDEYIIAPFIVDNPYDPKISN